MAKALFQYRATFADGETLTRGSNREYAAAWRATIAERAPKPGHTEARRFVLVGFARTRELARRSAATESRPQRFENCDVQIEVVDAIVERGPKA